jgi:hypothetical protein
VEERDETIKKFLNKEPVDVTRVYEKAAREGKWFIFLMMHQDDGRHRLIDQAKHHKNFFRFLKPID